DAGEQRDHDLTENECEGDRGQRRQQAEPTRFDGNVHSAASRGFLRRIGPEDSGGTHPRKAGPGSLSRRPEIAVDSLRGLRLAWPAASPVPTPRGGHRGRMTDQNRRLLLDERAVERTLARMAREIVERAGSIESLVLLGIQRRGVQLTERLAAEIERAEGVRPASGTLDITWYRDDLMAIGPRPVVGETRLPPGGIDGRVVVIVDDVCYTGRTARAALDELADFGRPARIYLCVLVDRGGRE